MQSSNLDPINSNDIKYLIIINVGIASSIGHLNVGTKVSIHKFNIEQTHFPKLIIFMHELVNYITLMPLSYLFLDSRLDRSRQRLRLENLMCLGCFEQCIWCGAIEP